MSNRFGGYTVGDDVSQESSQRSGDGENPVLWWVAAAVTGRSGF